MKAVVNSTPLIAFAITDNLEILSILFDEVFVPYSVYSEVTEQGIRPGADKIKAIDWFLLKSPDYNTSIRAELMKLDRGERDVILLASEVNADWLILDEKIGRKIAMNLGYQVKGTLGILLIACRAKIISQEESIKAVEILAQSSIRLSSKLLDWFGKQVKS
ncbi:MAG: DUF3368 domain-containing protein [Xenococcus sp. MO_188.B8]|nr:DUF3368 domain-containing protein [Xenococcus sp. MO_188.B8]